MKRLTQWFGDEEYGRVAGLVQRLDGVYLDDELIDVLLEALAHYEDTGLEPEEIVAINSIYNAAVNGQHTLQKVLEEKEKIVVHLRKQWQEAEQFICRLCEKFEWEEVNGLICGTKRCGHLSGVPFCNEFVSRAKVNCFGCSVPDFGAELYSAKELLEADKEGRISVLPNKKGHTWEKCGGCEHFEREPGKKCGTCEVGRYEGVVLYQSHKACAADFVPGSNTAPKGDVYESNL